MRDMKRIAPALTALLLAAVPLTALAAPPPQEARPVVFVDVSVVPMDRERVLEHQTVVVRGGRIAEIGPSAKVKPPSDAVVVEGRGKFLMPGLAEMHGHLPHPSQGEPVTKAFLTLFVANGVTTVRGMFGFPNHVALRDSVARRETFGPRLFVSSPALSGQSVPDPETGRRLVREHKQAGFDFLKVHEGLSKTSYDAIVATAKEVGIRFGGHIPDAVGLDGALAARQSSIEHLDGYLEALEADDSPIKNADPQTRAAKILDYLDERKIPTLAARTREAGVWNSSTMALWRTFYSTDSVEALQGRPELVYVPKPMVDQWAKQRAGQLQNPDDAKELQRVLQIRDRVLKALSDSGAKLLLGSDAPQLFSVPGFSLHREMEAMSSAGLTPYQILEAGTRNPSEYLGTLAEAGTVEVGKRADLILVDANPLADVRNVAKRSGVMVNGRWVSRAEIDKMLEGIATTIGGKAKAS
jgi:imidazolonepropionase-like amidohydrolase